MCVFTKTLYLPEWDYFCFLDIFSVLTMHTSDANISSATHKFRHFNFLEQRPSVASDLFEQLNKSRLPQFRWGSLLLKEPSDVQTEDDDPYKTADCSHYCCLYPVLFSSLKDSLKPWNFTCWLMAILLNHVFSRLPPSVPSIKLLVSIGATFAY